MPLKPAPSNRRGEEHGARQADRQDPAEEKAGIHPHELGEGSAEEQPQGRGEQTHAVGEREHPPQVLPGNIALEDGSSQSVEEGQGQPHEDRQEDKEPQAAGWQQPSDGEAQAV